MGGSGIFRFLGLYLALVLPRPAAKDLRRLKMVEASEEVYSSLQSGFKGDLLRPGQSGYEDARAIWNGIVVAKRPGRSRVEQLAANGDILGAIVQYVEGRLGEEAGFQAAFAL